jgi:hypothetical protein
MAKGTRLTDQPNDLAYAPPVYPTHNYRGNGEIVVVRLGREIVGWLSRKDWVAVGWMPRPGLSELANGVRVAVSDILRSFARDRKPMVDAWAEVLNTTQHDSPYTGPLGKIDQS